MSLKSKLDNWVSADLITPAQASAITTYESHTHQGRFKAGLMYVGVFSILLGLSLIVAANWQDIPQMLKLGAHFGVNIILAALIYHWRDTPARSTAREICLFLFWGLTLTLIALIGQTFQLSGDAWDAARFWFIITTPMMLLLSQGRYLSSLWAVFFTLFIPIDLYQNIIDPIQNINKQAAAFIAAYGALPPALYLASRIPAFTNARPHIAATFTNLSVLLALAAASITSTYFYHPETTAQTILYAAPVWLAICAALFALRRHFDKGMMDIFALSATFIAAPFILPIGGELPAMLHIVLLWIGAGYIFQRQGHHKLLNLAIIVVTLRLFIGFLELFGSMMMSGFGFIIMGLVLLALIYIANRLKQRLAT